MEAHGSYWPPAAERESGHKQIRIRQLRQAIDSALAGIENPAEVEAELLAVMEGDLRDVGIRGAEVQGNQKRNDKFRL